MAHFMHIENSSTATHPLTRTIEKRLQLVVVHRPDRLRRYRALNEVDAIVRDTPSAPYSGRATYLSTHRELDGRVNVWLLAICLGQFLIGGILLSIACLDKDHVNSSLARLQGRHNSCGACADDGKT